MYDDDYYDDDDEEYEDEDSSRGLLIALVIVLICGVLAIFVAISILVGTQTGAFDKFLAGDESPTPAVDEPQGTVSKSSDLNVAPSVEPAGEDSELTGDLGLEVAGSDSGLDAPDDGSLTRTEELDEPQFDEPATPSRTRMHTPRRSTSSSRSSGASETSSPSRSRSTRRSSDSSGRESNSSRSFTVNSGSRSESSSPRSSGSSNRRTSSSSADVPRVLDDDEPTVGAASRARAEARSGPTMSYEKDAITGLSSKAAGGALTDTQSRALQNVPGASPQFTLAWATVMKNAEVKKNYKEHCAAAAKVMEKPRNKYHPEWNLEMAKCHMRNRRYAEAVRSIDRTLGDSFGMTASTKVERLLLAYEIKAQSRTKLYDNHANANAGMSDKNKLNSAIQSWMEYLNYATGIANQKAMTKGKRELLDLEQRKGQ
jgi:hypothetical protein